MEGSIWDLSRMEYRRKVRKYEQDLPNGRSPLPCAIPLKLCRAKQVLQILAAIYQNET